MNQSRKDIVRSGAASAPRILVVEDESDLALLLAYNLGAEGYVVESVERGDEAELRLAENTPDLVILDWMLPGVSGLEICRRLRWRGNTRPSGHHGYRARRGGRAGARPFGRCGWQRPQLKRSSARTLSWRRRRSDDHPKPPTPRFAGLRRWERQPQRAPDTP
jgi:response regulator receiver domain-containing protein